MHWPPDPVAFTFGSLAVRWYGLWAAAGFLAVAAHWVWRARRDGRPASFGIDYALLVTLSGLLGSRLAFALAHLPHFARHPADLFRVDQGGLIFYGGFLLATGLVLLWARRRGESPWVFLDFGVSGMPLAHALGRLGCLFNGCCQGVACPTPWGWPAAGGPRVPVQLWEALFNLWLYAVLIRTYDVRRPGRSFALYLAAYGAWRFASEFVRGDARQDWGPLHVAQWISLALVASGLLLLRRQGEPARAP